MTRDESILLVDDHPIVRAGCAGLLTDAGFNRVTQAADGDAALTAYAAARPDLVVLDLNLKGKADGWGVATALLLSDPDAAILIFSMNDDPFFAARALKIGAKGYITKNDAPTTLVDAVDCVLSGQIYLSHAMARDLALMKHARPADPLDGLTAREKEVLGLLGKGLTLSAVADALGVSYKTAANACTLIKDKLGAESTRALIRIAIDNNLCG